MAKDNNNGANLGFESELWRAADALRSNMDAAEYKHVVLGLIFLKYISDAFEEQRAKLEADRAQGADPEDPDEYRAVNIFWVPKEARWSKLKSEAKQPTIGKVIDDAMIAIERDNPSLKGVLPKDYARPALDKQRLGQLIDLIGNIGLGDEANRSKDILGRVYEYFLSQFASAEGKKGGQFYTPRCVVRVLVEMLAPYKGRVYDPCCGSGGMFVQSIEFVKAHATGNGNSRGALQRARSDISIFGQESNPTTWRLAKMNLAIRQIDNNLGKEHADTFHRDLHPDLKADFILANPPFNMSDWGGERLKDDKRWRYGTPPASNANFAWVQHFIYHLAPTGLAGFVLAQASLSSESQIENEIRHNIIEDDLVDCIVTLPGKLFYSTPIPVCLWFLTRCKNSRGLRDRRGETLFIDASALGQAESRTHSYLTDEDIQRIAATYHSWRSNAGDYSDVPGFCASVSLARVRDKNYSLFPARYIAFDQKSIPDDALRNGDSFNVLVRRYRTTLNELDKELATLSDTLNGIERTSKPPMPAAMIKVLLSEVLERSDERLGNSPEPEILTCTERAGLILQRERFAKRVATEDTSKYKVVRRTDIVYNPYLLWAGAIDQCWAVDEGITSPAYEVLRLKQGWDATIVGALIKSPRMIKMYDGISVGTVQRRRRAPVERFLALKVQLPAKAFHEEICTLTESVQTQLKMLREAAGTLQAFMNGVANTWIAGDTEAKV